MADESPHCPLCEYDLRGLIDPRCPECGFTFDWDELRDPARRRHPYLFEHHPQHNVRSLGRTFAGGWRPARFWTTLYPSQPSRPNRLLLYWAIVAFLALLPLVWAIAVIYEDGYWRSNIDSFAEQIFEARNMQILMFATATLIAWPWLAFATLAIFQATIRRAKVKPVHLLRCTIYSSDVAVLGAVVLLVAIELARATLSARWFVYWRNNPITYGALVAVFVIPLIAAWRLRRACELYLKLEWPALVALLCHVMIFLVILKIALDLDLVRFY